MKCERFRDELEDWLDGGLNADERAGLERHVGDCPGCAQHLSQRRALGAALKKTFRGMGSELHFQPRPLSRRPVEPRPAGSVSGRPLGGPALRRPWFRPPLSAVTALAAVMIIALMFLFHPWTKTRPGAAPGPRPIAEITVSDSLDITDETIITGCTSGICYSIDMQISAIEINDPA